MNTFNNQAGEPNNGLEKISIGDMECTQLTKAILSLAGQPISYEELFGHTQFSPKQESAAGVLGLGKMYSSFSKKIYDEVLNPDLKYVTGK